MAASTADGGSAGDAQMSQDMLEQIEKAAVPQEALPTSVPRGKHSYTIGSRNGARIEVHLKGRKFYVAKAIRPLGNNSRSVSWPKHVSIDFAWARAKVLSGWDSPLAAGVDVD